MNQPTVPPSLNGFGTLALTNSAALLSTLTGGTGSPAYPTSEFPNQTVTITNQGTGTATLFPFGGTTTGIAIPLNATRTFNLGGTSPAVLKAVSATTATITVEW